MVVVVVSVGGVLGWDFSINTSHQLRALLFFSDEQLSKLETA